MPKRIYPLNPTLAATVAERRRALRWSQNRLALAAGLTEGLVAKLETCRTPFTPAHWAGVERALAAGELEAGNAAPAPVATGGAR
jgi:transcriptional regulator with XRE-family HTH domain